MNDINAHWKSLEDHSPTLYLVAGVLLIGYSALHGAGAFTDMTAYPVLFQFGYLIGFLGLLGVYRTLADRSPWLARVGTVAAISGLVGLSVITGHRLAELLGMTSGGLLARPLFIVLTLVGFTVGYLAVGVASLRVADHSRTIGLVLLVPGAIVVVMLVHIVAGYASSETAFVISAGEAMAHLAIGTTLRTEVESADSKEMEAEVASDATAR